MEHLHTIVVELWRLWKKPKLFLINTTTKGKFLPRTNLFEKCWKRNLTFAINWSTGVIWSTILSVSVSLHNLLLLFCNRFFFNWPTFTQEVSFKSWSLNYKQKRFDRKSSKKSLHFPNQRVRATVATVEGTEKGAKSHYRVLWVERTGWGWHHTLLTFTS